MIAQEYFLAATCSLLLLVGILWIGGFDLDSRGVLTWSDLDDHPTNWLDSVLHPEVATDRRNVDLW
jgi:hypothetical protein